MLRVLEPVSDIVSLEESETIIPDPGRLIFALRQIGYRLEQAIADLIDNSISAGASSVLIRFIWKDNNVCSVVIVDNGRGMDEDALRDAMRFGSSEQLDPSSLGKFGLGLKLASFSHARELIVATCRSGQYFARRWTLEGIRRDWNCEILGKAGAENLLRSPWSSVNPGEGGTVVVWNNIDKLPFSGLGLRATLRSLQRRLQLHLGLHFHRFLESGRLRILLDQQEEGRPEHGIHVNIRPLNPFGYVDSPVPEFPCIYKACIFGVGELDLEGHIWPSNSDLEEYRLDNRAAGQQGFYFYRNDRLIQAGGWNGLVQNDSEPHGSLARVRVDLSPELDSSFSLNVQKSSVVVPPAFINAVHRATDSSGVPFEHYRRTAQAVYRKEDRRALRERVPVAGNGMLDNLRKEMIELFGKDCEDIREIPFVWQNLEDDVFFRVDTADGRIILNDHYRDTLRTEELFDKDDLPLIKMLVFLLVRQDFQRSASGEKRRRELDRINKLLVSAIGQRPAIPFGS